MNRFSLLSFFAICEVHGFNPLHTNYPMGTLGVRSYHVLANMVQPWKSVVVSRSGLSSSLSTGEKAAQTKDIRPRIGIIGGGIAGVTVASSLVKRNCQADIVILEGDNPKPVTGETCSVWDAATARNANTMATGAAMHVFTRPSVVWDILKDTAVEEFRRVFPKEADDAFQAPPYFALHLWQCVGPSADAAERSSFVRFLFHFLYTTLVQGNRAEDRGKVLMQLAKANRVAYLQEKTPAPGHAQGFWSLHRSRKSAEGAMKEASQAGESSRFVEWEEAVQKEPRLARLPGQELGHQLYVVERVNDHVGNCGGFIRQKIQELKDKRVQYKSESVAKEVSASGSKQNRIYQVKTRDGAEFEFDGESFLSQK